jgi:hypothetical protein
MVLLRNNEFGWKLSLNHRLCNQSYTPAAFRIRHTDAVLMPNSLAIPLLVIP